MQQWHGITGYRTIIIRNKSVICAKRKIGTKREMPPMITTITKLFKEREREKREHERLVACIPGIRLENDMAQFFLPTILFSKRMVDDTGGGDGGVSIM